MPHDISLRLARTDDAASLLAIYAPYVRSTAISFELEPPSQERFAKRITRTLASFPWLVAESEELLGFCYASRLKKRAAYDWAVETSIYIRQEEMHKGLGRMLYQKLEELLRAQGILNCYACLGWSDSESPLLPHTSLHFHKAMGYQVVGHFNRCGYKFGQWWDILWLEKQLGPHAKPAPVILAPREPFA
ncbi:MAG: N-acetyltransferase [Desulfovibrio sp.]|nr:N-acetyltransferase [Desulfovibrio sp.]